MNKGDASVKIETEFDDIQRIVKSVGSNNDNKISSILISKCDFEIRKDSKNSIKFFNANSQAEIEVNDCIFTGNIADDSHHIEEQIVGRHSPKLMIKNCKFSSDKKNSLKLDPNHNVKLIQFSNQVYNYSKIENSDYLKTMTSIVISSLTVVTVMTLTVLFYLKRKNNEVLDKN